MPAIIVAHAAIPLADNVLAKLVNRPIAEGPDTMGEDNQWKVVTGALTYQGRIYIPAVDSLHGKVISLFHGNLESSHFGALETPELVPRDVYRPAMDSHVGKYISGWEVCHRIKEPLLTRHGINMPLETPSQQWEGVMMDFITELPESMALNYTSILVIVDWIMVLARGPVNRPAVRVRIWIPGRFGSIPFHKADPLLLGGLNPDPYPSTFRWHQVQSPVLHFGLVYLW